MKRRHLDATVWSPGDADPTDAIRGRALDELIVPAEEAGVASPVETGDATSVEARRETAEGGVNSCSAGFRTTGTPPSTASTSTPTRKSASGIYRCSTECCGTTSATT